jgi:hypothetical protein
MCQTIRLKNGDEIETVGEFEAYFGEFLEFSMLQYVEPYYSNIDSDYCLCCLDIKRFFADHPNLSFEFTGDWWEK